MKSAHKKTGNIFDVEHHNFDQLVIQASYEKPVLVDLWAEWCSPCLVIAPLLLQLIDEYEDKLLLARVEVDKDDGENMKVAGHYRVRGFPTVILFIDGKEKARFSGAKSLLYLRKFIIDHSGLQD